MKEAIITGVEQLATGVFSMWLKEKSIAETAKPGQFLSVYLNNKSKLLPRPISICEIEKEGGMLRIVFRVVGEGTREISTYRVSEYIKVMGPLGNGFHIENTNCAILIGGGIGIPPMLELAKQLTCKKKIILGYRDSDTFLLEELKSNGEIYLSTEDGSLGTKGNVIDVVKANQITGDMIYACGPTPMLKGVKNWAGENNIKAQLSMEERMACGIGACLACVCKSNKIDEHTNVHNKRICKDGPVFYADEIEL